MASGAMESIGYVVGDEIGGLRVGTTERLERNMGAITGPEYTPGSVGIEMTLVDCHCEK